MRFFDYDNCKKVAKATKISKRLVRMADSFPYDLGFDGRKLIIATDGDNIFAPHVTIGRILFTKEYMVMRWKKADYEAVFYKSPAEAILDSVSWLSAVTR